MFKRDEILISKNKNTLIEYNGLGDDNETFAGTVIKSEVWDEGEQDTCWVFEDFILATNENTPKKWHKYLIDRDREYSIRDSEEYKYSKDFMSKKFKIIETIGDVYLVELLDTKIVIRTFIPKFDIKELNDDFNEGKGYSDSISSFLKEEN